jgi:hypothetical protein
MTVHKYMKEHYGVEVWAGKKAAQAASKVNKLGISYDLYVSLACQLWHDYAMKQGWKYPYWNVLFSDNTVARLKAILDLANEAEVDQVDVYEFSFELQYAMGYIDWYLGNGERPAKMHAASARTKMQVSRYICEIYGVPYVSSNYNTIAAELASD